MNKDLNFADILDISVHLRWRIINECRISNATFWNWRSGKTPVPFWAKEKINIITKDLLGQEVFNLNEL